MGAVSPVCVGMPIRQSRSALQKGYSPYCLFQIQAQPGNKEGYANLSKQE